MMLTQLVDQYGWAELGKRITIKCFTDNPTIKFQFEVFTTNSLGKKKS